MYWSPSAAGKWHHDELMAARALGKPVYFYPAEVNHSYLIQRARKKNEPPPQSFWGVTHEVFGKQEANDARLWFEVCCKSKGIG